MPASGTSASPGHGFDFVIGEASLAAGPALAQEATTGDDAAATPAATTQDDGMDWGWIGLLGLIGLAGLRGRRDNTTTTRH